MSLQNSFKLGIISCLHQIHNVSFISISIILFACCISHLCSTGKTTSAAALALRAGVDIDMLGNAYMLGLPIALKRGDVTVDMSLTTPACPSGPQIMSEAEEQLKTIDGMADIAVVTRQIESVLKGV